MKNISIYFRYLIASIIIIIVYHNSYAQTTLEVYGNITENTTWKDDTIKVIEDVTVNSGITLSVKPGTYVEFQGYYTILVNGILKAEGIPGDTIIFTVKDTTGAANYLNPAGKWKGINFNRGSLDDTSFLSVCHILYAHGKSVYINGSYDMNVIISGSHFEKNYGDLTGAFEIRSEKCNVIIENCLINNNCGRYGGGIMCNGVRNVCIQNNIICNNQARGRGGGIEFTAYGGSVIGNLIKDNIALSGWGGGIYCVGEDIEIKLNNIVGNKAQSGGGIVCRETYNTMLVNNSFINNEAYSGGAIYCINSNFEINNNIITNNQCIHDGGGIYSYNAIPSITGNSICNNLATQGGAIFFWESKTKIINNILWGNTASAGNQIFINDNFSNPDIIYCTVENGVPDIGFGGATVFDGDYYENHETDPVFTNPSAGSGIQPDGETSDWSLQVSSPIINKGNPDLAGMYIPDKDRKGNNRIMNGRIDIGAIETHIEKVTTGGTVSIDSDWIADTVEVTGDVYVPDGITLGIVPGTKVIFSGHYKIDVHGRLLAIGSKKDTIYFTVKDTAGFSDHQSLNGSWGGIDFNNSGFFGGANGAMNDNDSSVFAYCVMKYVKDDKSGGGFYIVHFSKILIEHSNIQYCGSYGSEGNGGGIYCNYASPFISECNISKNFSEYFGSGIYCENSEPYVRNSILDNNISYKGSGSGLYMTLSSPVIENCIFTNNASHPISSFYGGAISSYHSNPVIVRCKVINNYHDMYGAAISCKDGKPVLINNLISNNTGSSYGSAVFFPSTEYAMLLNNTIVNNDPGGIYFYYSKASVYNSIFWGNSRDQVKIDGGSNNDISFNNCLIEGEIDIAYFDNGAINDFNNNLNSLPGFLHPFQIIGLDDNALAADWRIDQFSPCINSGQLVIPDFTLPEEDLDGNKRINGVSIDIGAYEHQGGIPHVTKQPSGGTKCAGTGFVVSIETSDSTQYQWQKDGVDIPGETGPELIIDTVKINDQGNYWCLVKNSYGTVTSNTATLFVIEMPEFLLEPQDMWAEIGENVMLRTYAKGTNTLFQWQKNGIDLQGEITPELNIPNIDYSNEGIYRCIAGNICGLDTTTPSTLYLAPQICMVTVSTITGNNLVVWEKNSVAPITAFNIYRESTAAGIFDLIGRVPYNNLSIFEDASADPTKRAYFYKITAVDMSGYETRLDLCKPHKTIHLIVTTNPELKSTQLQWDKYYGFDYQTYTIYRSTSKTNFTEIDSMPSSLNSWTEPEPITGEFYYRVAVKKPIPCFPSVNGKKADSGTYSHSMSNIDNNRLQAGESPPDTIMITNNSTHENNMYGILIGRFNTIDADTIDTHTYSLVSGEGDDDNISFTILGDMLLAAEIFDYELKNVYSIRVRCRDNANHTREEIFTIYIIETGVTDIGSSTRIQIYPNPFNESAILFFNNPGGIFIHSTS